MNISFHATSAMSQLSKFHRCQCREINTEQNGELNPHKLYWSQRLWLESDPVVHTPQFEEGLRVNTLESQVSTLEIAHRHGRSRSEMRLCSLFKARLGLSLPVKGNKCFSIWTMLCYQIQFGEGLVYSSMTVHMARCVKKWLDEFAVGKNLMVPSPDLNFGMNWNQCLTS